MLSKQLTAVGLCLALFALGCGSREQTHRITRDIYNSVELDMTKQQVENILGKPTTAYHAVTSATERGGQLEEAEWNFGNSGKERWVKIWFREGKVTRKDEKGLGVPSGG
jgi:hypothetical protein